MVAAGKEMYEEERERTREQLESRNLGHFGAIMKSILPSTFFADLLDTVETGLKGQGFYAIALWAAVAFGFDCPPHTEPWNTEAMWTRSAAFGPKVPYDQDNPRRPGSASFVLSRIDKVGVVLEGGEGVISFWRAQHETHGTGEKWDEDDTDEESDEEITEEASYTRSGRKIGVKKIEKKEKRIRLRGGAAIGEMGICSTRKIKASQAARNRNRARIEAVERAASGSRADREEAVAPEGADPEFHWLTGQIIAR